MAARASTATWSMSPLMSALPTVESSHRNRLALPSVRLSVASPPPSRLKISLPKPETLRSFVGLAPLNPLFYLGSEEHCFPTVPRRGSLRIVAMRHGKRVPKLSRPADQRRALLRGLTTQLLRHGRIKTTKAKASAMRKYVDKMITLAKDGSLHKRRQALGFIYDKQLVHALFAEAPERYGERNGGYTRITRGLPRREDVIAWIIMNLLAKERAQAQAWLTSFTEKERLTFENIFGRLASLLHVNVNTDFAIAAGSFWLPELNIFRFGTCELTPTIEEYCAILNAQNGSVGICEPKFPPGLRTCLSDLLGIKRKCLDTGSDGGHPTMTIEYLLTRFTNEKSFENHKADFTGDFIAWKGRRIMAFGFLLMGTILFPRDDGLIDGRLAALVTSLHQGRSYVPMILVETYHALTGLHAYPHTHFGGCIELLYLWLVEHVIPKKMTRYCCIDINPICQMEEVHATLKELPKGERAWVNKLKNLSPDHVNWFMGVFLPADITVRSAGMAFIPLVGLTCIVPYFGSRVMRQLGHRQEIPPEGNSEEFHYVFGNDCQDKRIQKALEAWSQRLITRRGRKDSVIETPGTVKGYDHWLQGQITKSEAPLDESISTVAFVPTENHATAFNLPQLRVGQNGLKGRTRLKTALANHSIQVSRLKLQIKTMTKKQKRMIKQVRSLKKGLCQQIEKNADLKKGFHQLSNKHSETSESHRIQINEMRRTISSLRPENKGLNGKMENLVKD